MADDSQDTLAKLRERLARVEKERANLRIAIQVITGEDQDWEEGDVPSEQRAIAVPDMPSLQASPKSRRMEIRPDSFFGLSQHQAARRYLQTLGHADRLENIFKAITAGGVEIGGASPLETLRAILARDSSVFVRVSPGTFGLREFYPQLGNKSEPRIRGRRAAKPKKKPNRKRPKVEPKATAKEKSPAPEKEA